jgi:solute carrier family 35 (adenosine 3'-phospho 5'-phosphosulfate transporter), member B3
LEALPKQAQLLILVGGVYLFFGIHNFLQEALMHQPGFSHLGVMLGYFEVLGVTLCCFAERQVYLQSDPNSEYGQRKAPLSAYPMLTLCLLSSSALSNLSLNYINFPTKVVFRSCKLIPTMVIASILHRKIFSGTEYICATMACVGLICFAAAEFQTRPSFHPIGLFLVSASVCADAILPNVQESLFRNYQASRLEVTLYTNAFTLILMTLSTLASGDLLQCLQLMRSSRHLSLCICLYTFIAYLAIGCHMTVVQRYGGVAAVLIATGRKVLTLIVSFLLFPKTFTWFYPLGTVLVLTGLTWASLSKVYSPTHKALPSSLHPSETRPFKAHLSDNILVDDRVEPTTAASPA